jgi:hypothetical protein
MDQASGVIWWLIAILILSLFAWTLIRAEGDADRNIEERLAESDPRRTRRVP